GPGWSTPDPAVSRTPTPALAVSRTLTPALAVSRTLTPAPRCAECGVHGVSWQAHALELHTRRRLRRRSPVNRPVPDALDERMGEFAARLRALPACPMTRRSSAWKVFPRFLAKAS